MSWENFLKTENLIALSSFFAAGASFWVSWLSYVRDSGRLDFYMGIGEIRNLETLALVQEIIQFRIVNSGRRPLTVSQIGGDIKTKFWYCFISKIWPKRFQPRGFIISSPIVDAALMPNGKSRVLNEGDLISFYLPLPAANDFLKQIAESPATYVYDTIGRKHRPSFRVMRKLRQDFKDTCNRPT